MINDSKIYPGTTASDAGAASLERTRAEYFLCVASRDLSAAASAVDSAERSGSTSRTRRTALHAANVPSEKSAMRRGPAAASSRAAATSARGAPAATSAAARPPPFRASFPSAPAAFASADHDGMSVQAETERLSLAALHDVEVILLEEEGNLEELRATFEELARTESDCSSAKRGGDLGFFGRRKMQPAFEEASFSLRIGELTRNIVETSSGVHLILRIG